MSSSSGLADVWHAYAGLAWWKKALLLLPFLGLLCFVLVREFWSHGIDTVAGRDFVEKSMNTMLDGEEAKIRALAEKKARIEKDLAASRRRREDAEKKLASDMDCIDAADNGEDMLECKSRIPENPY